MNVLPLYHPPVAAPPRDAIETVGDAVRISHEAADEIVARVRTLEGQMAAKERAGQSTTFVVPDFREADPDPTLPSLGKSRCLS